MLEYVQDGCFSFQFYIKPQLAITILALACRCFSFQFYIKPQQTAFSVRFQHGCFSFQFYIKPQHPKGDIRLHKVVSHSNSTSNHNTKCVYEAFCPLFLIPILHQTTTLHGELLPAAELFLIPILHQTTTALFTSCCVTGCFSFQFYIKPQPRAWQ